MIQINLLEEEKRKARSRPAVEPTKPLIYLAFAIVLAAVIFYDIKLFAQVNDLKAKVRVVQNKRKDPTHLAKLDEAAKLEKELEQLNKKQIIIEDLIQNRVEWAKKLGAIRDSLPPDIWVEQILLTNPTNPRETEQTLTIQAATLNHERGLFRTAETMERLNNSEDFMLGFQGDLEGVESRNEAWEKGAQEAPGDTRIWRFSIEARRPLPASEVQKKK
jgi:hypothetical protein